MAVAVAHTAGPASLLLSVRAGISSGRKAAALAVAASDLQATEEEAASKAQSQATGS